MKAMRDCLMVSENRITHVSSDPDIFEALRKKRFECMAHKTRDCHLQKEIIKHTEQNTFLWCELNYRILWFVYGNKTNARDTSIPLAKIVSGRNTERLWKHVVQDRSLFWDYWKDLWQSRMGSLDIYVQSDANDENFEKNLESVLEFYGRYKVPSVMGEGDGVNFVMVGPASESLLYGAKVDSLKRYLVNGCICPSSMKYPHEILDSKWAKSCLCIRRPYYTSPSLYSFDKNTAVLPTVDPPSGTRYPLLNEHTETNFRYGRGEESGSELKTSSECVEALTESLLKECIGNVSRDEDGDREKKGEMNLLFDSPYCWLTFMCQVSLEENPEDVKTKYSKVLEVLDNGISANDMCPSLSSKKYFNEVHSFVKEISKKYGMLLT